MGTKNFLSWLKSNKEFENPSDDDTVLYLSDGYDLDRENLEETCFAHPILVSCKDGLDLQVPPNTFSIPDVEDLIGSNTTAVHC